MAQRRRQIHDGDRFNQIGKRTVLKELEEVMSEDGQIASVKTGNQSRQEPCWTEHVTTIHEAQRAIAAELILSATEMSERFRTESHLWNELVSKIAEAHSIMDLANVWEECGRHQIEFARRETDRLFAHGQHALEVATGLLKGSARDEKIPAQ